MYLTKKPSTKKRAGYYVSKTLAMVLLVSACSNSGKPDKEQIRYAINQTPMIYTVEAVAQVYVESKDTKESVKSYFGDRTVVVPVKANVKAGIDLSKIQDINVQGDVVHVTLPDPFIEIESTEIVYEDMAINVSGIRGGFKDEEITGIAALGKDKIVENLPYMDLIEPAQQQAEAILYGIGQKLGVKIVFEPRPVYDKLNIENLVKR